MNECFDTRDGVHDAWSGPRFISTKIISAKYREYDSRSQRFGPTLSKEIADAITRLCPSATPDRKSLNNRQARGHNLPDLTTARQEFEATYKCKLDWGPNLNTPLAAVRVA